MGSKDYEKLLMSLNKFFVVKKTALLSGIQNKKDPKKGFYFKLKPKTVKIVKKYPKNTGLCLKHSNAQIPNSGIFLIF